MNEPYVSVELEKHPQEGSFQWSVSLWEWWNEEIGYSTVVHNITYHSTPEEAEIAGKALAESKGGRGMEACENWSPADIDYDCGPESGEEIPF
jgi:hypothetical protein|tara:strand:- start:367 stop:645 length:279 start_codon:yes stop_codon:yes gene_type:complete